MKSDPTLPRLEQASDDELLRRGIGAARRDVPDDERMRRLSLSLSAKLGGAGGAPGAGDPPLDPGAGGTGAGATGGALGAKAAGVAVSLLAAGAIWYAARSPAEPVTAATPPAVAPSALVAPPPTAPSALPVAEPIPTVSVDDLPRAVASAAPKPSATPQTPRESDMALLRRAQDALGSDPARALALLGEHAQIHPRSPFSQEREVLSIDALLRLGRRGEAEARADRFASAHPSSAHNRRIDSLLGR